MQAIFDRPLAAAQAQQALETASRVRRGKGAQVMSRKIGESSPRAQWRRAEGMERAPAIRSKETTRLRTLAMGPCGFLAQISCFQPSLSTFLILYRSTAAATERSGIGCCGVLKSSRDACAISGRILI